MTIKLDVLLVQLFHVVLLFWVFRKLIWNSLSTALLARKAQIAKLDNADAEYKRILAEAQTTAEETVKAWLQKKDAIIAEATLVAKRREEEIVSAAQKQAMMIQDEATQKAANLEKELKDGFVDGVKQTTKLVVNKLINDDAALQNSYIDALVGEFVGKK